ncbi:helix-hairpin-helix protein [Leeuwenhoekiella aestuarii]|uniref:helix-hairpin-helix domain-containing protein n=1 Tax=Leeuwenhoekiella aestuarii TaxID=2249426 RepID=UPI00102868C9|nr:hypothetical protein [Leeuwenhoekiella aestuarii]RXG17138.1 helix-hairpin-helix protein [Leeuwenhoekiella aestuarii]
MTAVLNNGVGFYWVEDYLNEIRKCGGQLELPCINTSDHPNSIIGTKIYLGFGMIKDLEARRIEKLLTQRQLYGRFTSLEDFVERVHLGLEQLVLLIRIGALRLTGNDRKELLWQVHLLINPKTAYDVPRLFSTKSVAYQLPNFKSTGIENAYDEIELLEFHLCSRFDLLEAELPRSIMVREVQDHIGQTISICGVMVTAKRVPLDGGRTMYFGTFLDREGVFFDTVHFPDSVAHSFMSGKEVYQVIGKVTQEYELCSIIVDRVIRLTRKTDPRFSDASDFKRVVG